MRGKLVGYCILTAFRRITPAGAGKTSVCVSGCIFSWDHPRRCGENGIYRQQRKTLTGSPPQVRGKPQFNKLFRCNTRITPAGAGKTSTDTLRNLRTRDHPRRCGENSRALACRSRARGSPPQVRGKQMPTMPAALLRGITPAGAGKTPPKCDITSCAWDHPRRCGENLQVKVLSLLTLGSPPQVRGKRALAALVVWL